MIIHNIYTSSSRKYPAHYALKKSLEIKQGVAGLTGLNFILKSCLRNLTTGKEWVGFILKKFVNC